MQALRHPDELLSGCGSLLAKWAPHDVRFSDTALVSSFLSPQTQPRGRYRIANSPRWVVAKKRVLTLLQNHHFLDNAHGLLQRYEGQRAASDDALEQALAVASTAISEQTAAQLFPQLASEFGTSASCEGSAEWHEPPDEPGTSW